MSIFRSDSKSSIIEQPINSKNNMFFVDSAIILLHFADDKDHPEENGSVQRDEGEKYKLQLVQGEWRSKKAFILQS